MSARTPHTEQAGADPSPAGPGAPETRAADDEPKGWAGCFLARLLDASTNRRAAWTRSRSRARKVEEENPRLYRSVTGWVALLSACALAGSALVAVASRNATGAWITVGVTAVWSFVLWWFFQFHLAVMRSEDGKLRRTFGLPNVLTTMRLLCAPTMAYFLANPLAPGRYSEAVLYTLLALGITDILDGVAARMLDQRTDFGKYTDPLTDLLVTSLAALGVCLSGAVPWWLGGMVIFRYFGAFAGFALVFTRTGTFDFQPTWVGKLCTPAVQLLFFALTLGLIRTDLALPSFVWQIAVGTVGAWVAFNIIFLSVTLFRLLNVPQRDTP